MELGGNCYHRDFSLKIVYRYHHFKGIFFSFLQNEKNYH